MAMKSRSGTQSGRWRYRFVPWLAPLVVLGLSFWASEGLAVMPEPTHRDVSYGPDPRNCLDYWSAGNASPTPVVVFFHGGGFRSGDKAHVPEALVEKCLAAGISVASANYRLSSTATYPAFMHDGARAVQFLHLKATEWGIQPDRIMASGSSAGAGIALWIGYHDDLRNPESADPVERESSRLAGMAVMGAQTTYSIPQIAETAGLSAAKHSALKAFYGLSTEDFAAGNFSDEVKRAFVDASPITYLSEDDPPAFLYYWEPWEVPGTGAEPGMGIHSPHFGPLLKELAMPLGLRVELRHRDELGPLRGEKVMDALVAFCREVVGGE